MREALRHAAQSETELLRQHQGGAWENKPHLQTDNLAALNPPDWICSSFELPTGQTVWLCTEPNRASTVALLRGIPCTDWTRRGIMSGNPATARAVAYILAGHERHHAAVLAERYGV